MVRLLPCLSFAAVAAAHQHDTHQHEHGATTPPSSDTGQHGHGASQFSYTPDTSGSPAADLFVTSVTVVNVNAKVDIDVAANADMESAVYNNRPLRQALCAGALAGVREALDGSSVADFASSDLLSCAVSSFHCGYLKPKPAGESQTGMQYRVRALHQHENSDSVPKDEYDDTKISFEFTTTPGKEVAFKAALATISGNQLMQALKQRMDAEITANRPAIGDNFLALQAVENHVGGFSQPTHSEVHIVDWGQTIVNTPSSETSPQHNGVHNAGELKMLACDKGNKLKFQWNTPGVAIDLYRVNLESEYITCDFRHAVLLAPEATTGEATFLCDVQGAVYFRSTQSCGGGGGGDDLVHYPKLRAQVTDMSQTALLRATANTNAGYEGSNHWSYAMVIKGFILDADFNDGFDTSQAADTAQHRLWCVQPHAPDSCRDWFPARQIEANPHFCEAMIEADIGFAYRKRPEMMLSTSGGSAGSLLPQKQQFFAEKAMEYYDKSLALIPDFCPALSYKAGLFAQLGDGGDVRLPPESGAELKSNKVRADELFGKACLSCGHNSLDLLMLKEAYAKNNWQLPCSVDAKSCVPGCAATTSLQATAGASPIAVVDGGTTPVGTSSSTIVAGLSDFGFFAILGSSIVAFVGSLCYLLCVYGPFSSQRDVVGETEGADWGAEWGDEWGADWGPAGEWSSGWGEGDSTAPTSGTADDVEMQNLPATTEDVAAAKKMMQMRGAEVDQRYNQNLEVASTVSGGSSSKASSSSKGSKVSTSKGSRAAGRQPSLDVVASGTMAESRLDEVPLA
eukprot:CAMPEP_0178994364 /NCGR_PEP_ID=MMETSP0795-20121207/7231_1 /TAXON_ID=88552 /ORGANISM="Amoebophrya sp., Strain Ameob2" /LENGTH=796 /DNA_ID=CAMNT_0020686553 /DNA_START=196 /DNA_END=2589 /DNA_ORIENTATION=-